MVSERDPSQLSVYRLNVDNKDLGKFKSSGILVSTGTGSTGWLYSARAIAPKTIDKFKKLVGLKKQTED